MKAYIGIVFFLIAIAVYFVISPISEEATTQPTQSRPATETTSNREVAGSPLPFRSTLVPGKPDEVVLAERKAKKNLMSLLSSSPSAKMMYSLAEAQKDPVGFYAKIIDQYGHSVKGVRIRVGLGGVYGATSIQTTSDAQGRFSVNGVEATSMGAEEMVKPGYEFYLRGVYFRSYVRKGERNRVWSDYTPDNPFVYHAWKIGEPGSVIHEEYKRAPLSSGMTYTVHFDRKEILEKGKKKGDLWITLNRPTNITPRDKVDWSIKVEAVGGGLIETDDLFMYDAPETGYQPIWEKHYVQVVAAREVERKFYIKTRNGKLFGNMRVGIQPAFPGSDVAGIVFYQYTVNLNGSRNLYYDQNTRRYAH